MKTGVLFSGGKDSTYSAFLHKNRLCCLISMVSENPDSYMFQQVSEEKVKEMAKKIGIPILIQKTKGIKEEELKDLKEVIKKAKEEFRIEAIVAGAVASNYQRTRIQEICYDLGLYCLNPLWDIKPEKYWRKLLENNFKIKIVKVAAEGLDASWVGKIIDGKNLEELRKLSEKFQFDLRGEGGEFETEVIDCPLFKNV
ncbi:MAG: diphthine--ammonia ligase [archaeon]